MSGGQASAPDTPQTGLGIFRTPLADEITSWREASGGGLHLLAFMVLVTGIALVTANGLRVADILALSDVPFLLAGVLLLFLLPARSEYLGFLPHWFYLSAVVLLASGLFSTIVAPDTVQSGVSFAKFFYAAYLFPLLLGLVVDRPAWLYRALSIWILFATLNGLSGLLDLVGLTQVYRWLDVQTLFPYVVYPDRAFGLTTYPNHYGLACAMALPVALALAALTSGWRRLGYITGVLVLAAGVLASGSRAMLLASVIVALVLIPWSRVLGRIYLALGGMLVVAFAALMLIEPSLLSKVTLSWHRLVGAVSVGESDALRVEHYGQTVQHIVSSPVLGSGFSGVRYAHNIYVQVLQAGGLIGLTGMAIYVLGYLSTALSLSRGLIDWRWSLTVKAIAASALVWLVSGLVQNAIYDRYLYLPVGFLFSMIIIAHRYRVLLPGPPADGVSQGPGVSSVDESRGEGAGSRAA